MMGPFCTTLLFLNILFKYFVFMLYIPEGIWKNQKRRSLETLNTAHRYQKLPLFCHLIHIVSL